MKIVKLGIALATLIVLAGACRPIPYAQQDQRPPATYAECSFISMPACGVDPPVVDANGTLVVGDSITWPLGIGFAMPGWQVGHVLEHVKNTPGITKLVIALGTNDARTFGGWNDYDIEVWTEILSLGYDTVVILPALGPGAPEADRIEVDKARAWIISTGVKYVEWQQYANDPEVVQGDAVHLVESEYARSVRVAVINEAAAL